MARLKNTKPSKNVIDHSWVPEGYVDPLGFYKEIPAPNTVFQDSTAGYTPDEVKMIRSGASFRDILFYRLLKQKKAEPGWSPAYFPVR